MEQLISMSMPSYTKGFSTLEILIAMAIMTSTLSAVLLVAFGNQSLLEEGSISVEALQKAQAALETEQAYARMDFRLVGNTATSSGIYQQSLAVSDVRADPYTTKRLTSTVSWQDESHITRSVSLTTLVTDFQDPSTLDTCDSALTGDWSSPSIKNYVLATGDLLSSSAPSGHTFSATNPISGIDAYQGRLYISISKKAAAANDSLFVFNNSDSTQRPSYLGSIDNNPSVIEGLNAIVVAGSYLYGANAHVTNFKTCKPSPNCSQLQLFAISSPGSIPAPVNFLIPTSSAPFVTGTSTSQAVGNSIFYQNGYVYLGLTKTATGPEFNIIDVHDPNNPAWAGGYAIGATINQIYVRNGYAYLATDDQSRKLMIFDVHDPKNPSLVASLDPKGMTNQPYGYSLYTIGDDLFFGMSSTSISGSPELYEYDVSHPSSPRVIASAEVGASIMGIFVRDSDIFLLNSVVGAKAAFLSLDSASFGTASSITLPGSGVSLDCEGNYFYAASNNGAQGDLSIIGPGT
jgi:Tfp pilus assembly protein PilV